MGPSWPVDSWYSFVFASLLCAQAGAFFASSYADGGTVWALLGLSSSWLIHFAGQSTFHSSESWLFTRVVPPCLQCAAVLCTICIMTTGR